MRKPRSRRPEPKSDAVPSDETPNSFTGIDEEQWNRDMATLRRAAEEIARKRPIPLSLERRNTSDIFHRLADSLSDSTTADKARTIRKLYNMDPERAATFLNITLEECVLEERQQIGAAL